jgi:hypothetical protein
VIGEDPTVNARRHEWVKDRQRDRMDGP